MVLSTNESDLCGIPFHFFHLMGHIKMWYSLCGIIILSTHCLLLNFFYSFCYNFFKFAYIKFLESWISSRNQLLNCIIFVFYLNCLFIFWHTVSPTCSTQAETTSFYVRIKSSIHYVDIVSYVRTYILWNVLLKQLVFISILFQPGAILLPFSPIL